MTDEFSTYDAAYVLGSLTPQDRADYEAHLADCADCRHAVIRFAGVPGLLASVSPDAAREAGGGVPDVPDTLLPRLLAEVERTRFRRRWALATVGAAAAAVVAIALVVGLHGTSHPTRDTAIQPLAQKMTPVSSQIPISATAWLSDKGWGTQITIECTYHGAQTRYPVPITYTMVVTDTSGATQQIAAWAAVPGKAALVDGSTSVARSHIAEIEVLGPQQQPVLTLQL